MSRCATLNLFLQQGEARAMHIRYVDKEDEPVVDLSTYEGVLQVREDYASDATMLLELTSQDNEITFDGADGSIYITFPLSKVNDLPVDERGIDGWVYGFQIYDPTDKDNTARLLLRGEVAVQPTAVRE